VPAADARTAEAGEPDKPAEAGKDMRIAGSGPYAVMPHPTDGRGIWVGGLGLVHLQRGRRHAVVRATLSLGSNGHATD
jgi:hypothetical protein